MKLDPEVMWFHFDSPKEVQKVGRKVHEQCRSGQSCLLSHVLYVTACRVRIELRSIVVGASVSYYAKFSHALPKPTCVTEQSPG